MQEAAVLLQGNMRVRLARGEFRKARAAAEVKQVALELQRARARQRDAKVSTPGVSPQATETRITTSFPPPLARGPCSRFPRATVPAQPAPLRSAPPRSAPPRSAPPRFRFFSLCAMPRPNAETERCAALDQARALKRHARRRR
jgi:hypothetical protein